MAGQGPCVRCGHHLRPKMVQFYRCRDVLVSDLTIVDPPMWTVHPLLSTNVTVRNVTWRARSTTPTRDPSVEPRHTRRRFKPRHAARARRGRAARGRAQREIVVHCTLRPVGGITGQRESAGATSSPRTPDQPARLPAIPGSTRSSQASRARSRIEGDDGGSPPAGTGGRLRHQNYNNARRTRPVSGDTISPRRIDAPARLNLGPETDQLSGSICPTARLRRRALRAFTDDLTSTSHGTGEGQSRTLRDCRDAPSRHDHTPHSQADRYADRRTPPPPERRTTCSDLPSADDPSSPSPRVAAATLFPAADSAEALAAPRPRSPGSPAPLGAVPDLPASPPIPRASTHRPRASRRVTRTPPPSPPRSGRTGRAPRIGRRPLSHRAIHLRSKSTCSPRRNSPVLHGPETTSRVLPAGGPRLQLLVLRLRLRAARPRITQEHARRPAEDSRWRAAGPAEARAPTRKSAPERIEAFPASTHLRESLRPNDQSTRPNNSQHHRPRPPDHPPGGRKDAPTSTSSPINNSDE